MLYVQVREGGTPKPSKQTFMGRTATSSFPPLRLRVLFDDEEQNAPNTESLEGTTAAQTRV